MQSQTAERVWTIWMGNGRNPWPQFRPCAVAQGSMDTMRKCRGVCVSDAASVRWGLKTGLQSRSRLVPCTGLGSVYPQLQSLRALVDVKSSLGCGVEDQEGANVEVEDQRLCKAVCQESGGTGWATAHPLPDIS